MGGPTYFLLLKRTASPSSNLKLKTQHGFVALYIARHLVVVLQHTVPVSRGEEKLLNLQPLTAAFLKREKLRVIFHRTDSSFWTAMVPSGQINYPRVFEGFFLVFFFKGKACTSPPYLAVAVRWNISAGETCPKACH